MYIILLLWYVFSYFDGLRAAVYEITQEQEVGFRRPAGHVEHPEQINELAVQVADHFDRSPKPQQHGLPEERAPSVHAQGPYARFFAKAARGAQQAVDNVVVGTASSWHDVIYIMYLYCDLVFGISKTAAAPRQILYGSRDGQLRNYDIIIIIVIVIVINVITPSTQYNNIVSCCIEQSRPW